MLNDALRRIEELRPLAAALNAASDALRVEIEAVESHLQSLGVGLVAKIALPGGLELSYRKIGHRWRLVVDDKALLDCSREIKILAAPLIPQLLERLIERAGESIVQLGGPAPPEEK